MGEELVMEASYGILDVRAVESDEVSRIGEELRYRGFAVAKGALSSVAIEQLCVSLDHVYREQCAEVGGEEVLRSLKDEDIVRCPLAYDQKFLELAQHPLIHAVARRVLGQSFVLLMQNGIINRPDRIQTQTRWHRDLNYQHWVCSKPLAIGALVCLEDFNEETGATKFLSGSHKFEEFPDAGFVARFEEGVEAPKGSILFFDAMTFHRAGVNKSQNTTRRAINHVIGAPILSQQIDIPAMLGGKSPDDPAMAGYLGFRWNPSESVREWRLSRTVSQKRQ